MIMNLFHKDDSKSFGQKFQNGVEEVHGTRDDRADQARRKAGKIRIRLRPLTGILQVLRFGYGRDHESKSIQ